MFVSRNIPADMLLNFQQQNGENVFLIEILTDVVVRLAHACVDINYAGNTFYGGEIQSFSLPKESLALTAAGMKLVLSGVNLNHIANLQTNYEGKMVNVYLATVVDGVIQNAMTVYAGEIDDIDGVDGRLSGKKLITVAIKNPLYSFDETRGHITSDAYQQRNYAGDRTFEFVAEKARVG